MALTLFLSLSLICAGTVLRDSFVASLAAECVEPVLCCRVPVAHARLSDSARFLVHRLRAPDAARLHAPRDRPPHGKFSLVQVGFTLQLY